MNNKPSICNQTKNHTQKKQNYQGSASFFISISTAPNDMGEWEVENEEGKGRKEEKKVSQRQQGEEVDLESRIDFPPHKQAQPR